MTDNEDRNTLDYDCCNAPVERAIRAEHLPRLPVFLIFGAVVLLFSFIHHLHKPLHHIRIVM